MFRRSRLSWKPKTLDQMFRKLKLAGAHPDVLWGIDAQKAQHNGEEMIRLETVMHQRATQTMASAERRPGDRMNAAEHFLFWLKSPTASAVRGAGGSGAGEVALRAVQCTITPHSASRVVKQQLTQLFEEAGVLEDFELGEAVGAEMNLESVLRYADERHTEHLFQASTLYIRGDRSVENLRRFGVLLVVEEDGVSYLVTLPEMVDEQPFVGDRYTSRIGSGGPSSTYVPAKGIIGPNGEIDPDVQDYMTERGLRPFDLRMAGSHSSVERFVTAFERIERMYDIHRGRALRPSVCLVLSLTAQDNYVAPDGCIVLCVQRISSWEEYLLSLPQDVWQSCVQQHKDWRLGKAPKLQERKRQLMRVADMFHVFRVTLECPMGGEIGWQDAFLQRLMKEETQIRRAVEKYRLKSEVLKRRGELCVVERLYSTLLPANAGSSGASPASASDGRKEIGFRVCGDGKLYFNQRVMNTGQMLRVLKDNLKQIEAFQRGHDQAITALERVSRNVPVDFSVDTAWKLREEGNLVHCLNRFVQTIKQNEAELGAFLRGVMQDQSGHSDRPHIPSHISSKKRMVWVIADRFDTLPSGIVFVPYDVEFESIKKMLLAQK